MRQTVSPRFVANSPFMSFSGEHPEEYRQHLTHEGELNRRNAPGKRPIIRMRFRMVWARVVEFDYRGAGTG